ncbi:MAG: hypothetical protein QM747_07645 [Nocardioides sp.]
MVNLFFKYDFEGGGLTDDLALTLHVNNVLDTSPPVFRDGAARQNGFPSGQSQTLGRVVQFGLSKKS